MTDVIPGLESGEGREVRIDLAQVATAASGSYANFVLTRVDDHVVRMSVMTEPFYWHRHPDSDEAFLVVEGEVLLETVNDRGACIVTSGRVEWRQGSLQRRGHFGHVLVVGANPEVDPV